VFDALLFGEALVDELPAARVPGGAPFNVACHLRAFGVSPLLVTRIGRDEDGRRLLGAFRRRGLDTRGVQRDAERPTARVVVRETADGPRFEIPADQAFDFVDEGAALASAQGAAPRVVYFGTLAQRNAVSRAALKKLLDVFGVSGGLRFLDVNLRAPWFDRDTVDGSLRRASIAKMNEEEAGVLERLLGIPAKGRELRQALASRYRLESVVVTRGSEGAVWQDAEGAETRLAREKPLPRPIDTVGAGDAFSAAMILGSLRGWAPELTIRRADAFARAVCRLRGALPRRLSFYGRFVKDWETGKSS